MPRYDVSCAETTVVTGPGAGSGPARAGAVRDGAAQRGGGAIRGDVRGWWRCAGGGELRQRNPFPPGI